jgi:peptidoglycan/xylan/chitin deacetylase (PgdA/CDA1 family)
MIHVFICVDFDRDYGYPVSQIKHAVSKPIHLRNPQLIDIPQKAISTKGTVNSYDLFIQYLLDEKLPATFFFEARSVEMFSDRYPEKSKLLNSPLFELGVHGYDHEDLTGEETGITFSKQAEEKVIKKAQTSLETIFPKKMTGFRAPYMRITENTHEILSEMGFLYDSSIYQDSICAIHPHLLKQNLVEFPVIKTPKESSMKGMYTYLWPLFEGNRKMDNTITNYLQIIENSVDSNSYISINLHSWHFAYNIKQDRYLSTEDIVQNFNMFAKLISSLKETERVVFSTPEEWLIKHKSSLDLL